MRKTRKYTYMEILNGHSYVDEARRRRRARLKKGVYRNLPNRGRYKI